MRRAQSRSRAPFYLHCTKKIKEDLCIGLEEPVNECENHQGTSTTIGSGRDIHPNLLAVNDPPGGDEVDMHEIK